MHILILLKLTSGIIYLNEKKNNYIAPSCFFFSKFSKLSSWALQQIQQAQVPNRVFVSKKRNWFQSPITLCTQKKTGDRHRASAARRERGPHHIHNGRHRVHQW